jgi:hypothetical protein
MSEPTSYLDPRRQAVLLRRIGALTVDDLHGLDAAVRELVAEKAHKHVDKGYFFAWGEGREVRDQEGLEIQDLFAAVLAALAGGLTGLDVERVGARFAPKPSGLQGLVQSILPSRPSRRLQDASIGLIEDELAPWDPRLAIVAIWNAACAVMLREHLTAATVEKLEAPWRRALGEPPA